MSASSADLDKTCPCTLSFSVPVVCSIVVSSRSVLFDWIEVELLASLLVERTELG